MKVTSRSENLFYNNQEDSFSAVEDCNLTDEILSEGADVNSPAYIENITKNMELSPFSKKNSFVVSNRSTFDSILMKSYFTPDQCISEIKPSKDLIKGQKTAKKRTLKEDISHLLKLMVNEKRKSLLNESCLISNILMINKTNDLLISSTGNSEESKYVTMKEIQSIADVKTNCFKDTS